MKDYKKEEIEFEDKIAKNYNNLYHRTRIQKDQIRQYVQYATKKIKKGDKVLDLGCGAASIWYELKNIKDIDLMGVDISPKMIKEAKKLYPKDKFLVADSEKLPFKDESFDVIVCSSVLHHLPKPDKALKEMRRVLKPYGKLIGREPQEDQFVKETSSWISGTIMMLVHMVQRREKPIIETEPPIHEYHQSYKLTKFIKNLALYFVVQDVESVWPISSLFIRIKSTLGGNLILKTDEFLKNYKGTNFFYLAVKNGYGRTEVLSYINSYLRTLKQNGKKTPLKFVKRLIWLTVILDLILPRKI